LRPDRQQTVIQWNDSWDRTFSAVDDQVFRWAVGGHLGIDEEKRDRNVPIQRYVPEWAKTAYRAVSPRQFHNHTTGMQYGKDEEDL